ncbi:hypothetical protein Poli38472_011532 [Pythium oligandrum]|uniref:Uncharacterized protein n=1 Tax=Pythium oligandrum TaxID=41045 RepID=A0A8K1FMA2_PYTOL|nr:hypothetical protein Poli38472_011532 [Pythium oligandrum]|eukprot:TMW64652.1 hypothetical protein Poli38472_011532 [Pythium oligandrum]
MRAASGPMLTRDVDMCDELGAGVQQRPELEKLTTIKTTNEHPHKTLDERIPKAASFTLLRDYEMATSILEARRRAQYGDNYRSKTATRPRPADLDRMFQTDPVGRTKITLDSPPKLAQPRIARTSSSDALSNSAPPRMDARAKRPETDPINGNVKKTKKSVSFQESSPRAVLANQQYPHMHRHDKARCEDDSNTENAHVTSPIHAACWKGDQLVVKHLLSFYRGDECAKLVNSTCACGMTPLQVACDRGHVKIVKLLLRRYGKLNKHSSISHHTIPESMGSPVQRGSLTGSGGPTGKKRHRSCIALASQRQSIEMVELLMEHGAQGDEDSLLTASSLGNVPLVRALVNGQKKQSSLSSIEKLWGGSSHSLTEGVIESSWISHAASIALENDHPGVLTALLGDGRSSSSRDRITHCALEATNQADYKLLRCLTKMFDVKLLSSATDASGCTLLHLAVKKASTKCVTLLVRLGLDVNTRGNCGISPLYLACARGQSSIVRLLINAGATCERMGPNDETPLHIASQENHLSCVELLLAEGKAKVDESTTDRCTPLHLACQRGNTLVAKCLLDHGADVNARTLSDETPLLKATRMSNLETVKMLLARNAQIASPSSLSASADALAGRFKENSDLSSSSVLTSSSHSTYRDEVESEESISHHNHSTRSLSTDASDNIFIAKTNTHTSFKGWLKSVIHKGDQ